MHQECRTAGLPEPLFEEKMGGLWVTFRKDIFTKDYLVSLGLNERQIQALQWIKSHGQITNSKYQNLFGVSKRTASHDLSQLESMGLIEQIGTTGKGTYYRIRRA
jgi:ATP-dependent DNA helicase RecG